ncbi:MAG: ABC transporter ATP-binding protein [Pyrinomonadaceae bacterium]
MARPFYERIRTAVANLGYVPRALTLVWQAVPGWTSVGLVLIALQGGLPAALVYLTKVLVDLLVAAKAAGGAWPLMRNLLIWGGAVGALLLLNELLTSISRWVRTAQAEYLHDHIRELIHDRAISADLGFYEQPEYYDHLHRARDESSHRSVELVGSLGQLLQSGITLVALAAVLIPYGIWLPLALLLSTGPAFFVVLRFSLRQHDWRRRNTPDERRTWYYDWLLTGVEAAPELRLFGLGRFFKDRYAVVRQRLRGEKLALARDQGVAEFSAALLALGVTGAVLAWMVWRVVRGAGTLGDIALFYQAFYQGQSLMRSLLGNLGQLYANSLFLGDLFLYLGLQPTVVDPVEASDKLGAIKSVAADLELRQVTFSYPGASRPALKDFDLTIMAGQIVAIVGANGAGKSTLVKLLCRFYDPQAGTISVGGVALREMPLAEVRRMMTVLFQEPMHYSTSVAENIEVGHDQSPARRERVQAAARAAGADTVIEKLPGGYDQLLGRWFAGGAELSAGEWQRIALARAFLRDSPILLLDEPTSAMDPWAEAEWLDHFRQIANGRTAVIITHRFTTARFADVIHVMDDGRIVESGTHDELLACGGRYAESWATQMKSKAASRTPSGGPAG